jgi:hypothetical protein
MTQPKGIFLNITTHNTALLSKSTTSNFVTLNIMKMSETTLQYI